MNENRLKLIAPDLSDKLLQVAEAQQRKVALVACEYVAAQCSRTDPILDEGRAALREGRYGDQALRQALEALVARLDDIQWDLQEQMHEGQADEAAYLSAFRCARAAHALYFALGADAFSASTEAVYEANAATDDFEGLKRVILEVLDHT